MAKCNIKKIDITIVKESQLYADEFLSPETLQWESQSTTSINSPTGQNLINISLELLKIKKIIENTLTECIFLY